MLRLQIIQSFHLLGGRQANASIAALYGVLAVTYHLNFNEVEENELDGNLPEVEDGLLEKMKNIFFQEFYPVHSFGPGVLLKSTREIYEMFQGLYRNEILYDCSDVAKWLHEKGFTFINSGELKYEWMLKKLATF